MSRNVVVLVLLLAVPAISASAGDDPRDEIRSRLLRTVEGRVSEVSTAPAEGDLAVVAVRLDTAEADEHDLQILLEFTVEKGDLLRARVFVADRGPFKAHKVMNRTRGTMVRFRTLSSIPLWTSKGRWEGGACRRQTRYRGGSR
jgi:hypothetical protein